MRMRQIGVKALLVGAAACALLCAGCSQLENRQPKTFAGHGGRYLAEGKAALLAGDTQRARQLLRKALDRGESAEARYYLTLIEVTERGVQNSAPALREIGRSLRAYPSAQGYLLQGVLLEDTDPAAALKSYRLGLEKAEEKGPVALLLQRNAGVLLARQAQWEEARAHLESYVQGAQAAGMRLQDADYALWGLLLFRSGDEEQAQKAWGEIRDPELREQVARAAGHTDVEVTSFAP